MYLVHTLCIREGEQIPDQIHLYVTEVKNIKKVFDIQKYKYVQLTYTHGQNKMKSTFGNKAKVQTSYV